MTEMTVQEIEEVSGGFLIPLGYAVYWIWTNRNPAGGPSNISQIHVA